MITSTLINPKQGDFKVNEKLKKKKTLTKLTALKNPQELARWSGSGFNKHLEPL